MPSQEQERQHAVIKTGWLYKKGAVRRNWKKRWFVLTESHLRYYTGESLAEEKGLIVLQARPPPRRVESTHDFAFEIPGVSSGSKLVKDGNYSSMFRTFSVYAETKEEMTDWIDKVR